MTNKGSVLRVETTIVHPKDFRTYRKPEGQPKQSKRWLDMRRGVADLKRRADISARCNHRYLEALGSTCGKIPLFEWAQKKLPPHHSAGPSLPSL